MFAILIEVFHVVAVVTDRFTDRMSPRDHEHPHIFNANPLTRFRSCWTNRRQPRMTSRSHDFEYFCLRFSGGGCSSDCMYGQHPESVRKAWTVRIHTVPQICRHTNLHHAISPRRHNTIHTFCRGDDVPCVCTVKYTSFCYAHHECMFTILT